MGKQDDFHQIAELAGRAAEQAVQGNAAALSLLLAEMQALGALMPGLSNPVPQDEVAHDAEVEAGFDNMPV
jgi:hypothetical protein